jgi:hypothetical protein
MAARRRHSRSMAHDPFDHPLRVGVEIVDIKKRTWCFRLVSKRGACLLSAKRRPESPYADATFEAEDPEKAALFVRDFAQWLRVPVAAATRKRPPAKVPIELLSMGHGMLKVFIGEAQIFLNVQLDDDLADFSEKDVHDREELVAQLHRALGDVAGTPAVTIPPRERMARERWVEKERKELGAFARTVPQPPFEMGQFVVHAKELAVVVGYVFDPKAEPEQMLLELETRAGERFTIGFSKAREVLTPAQA